MSKLIALIYADVNIPAEIYEEVHRLQDDGHLDLIDVTEVEVKDNGKIKFEKSMSIPLVGHTESSFLPALIGILFFNPQQPVNDNVRKTLAEISLDPQFIKNILEKSSPRNSILFLYVQDDLSSHTLAQLTQHGGEILQMPLSGMQEERLQRLFRGHHWDHQETTLHSP